MLPDLARALAALGMVTLLGLPVLLLLPPPLRGQYLVATPVLGAAGLAVLLHSLALFAPAGVLGVVLLVAATLTAVAARKPLRPLLNELRGCLPALSAGLACLVLALLPSQLHPGASVRHVSINHDAFFYVSATQWLHEEGIQTPKLSSEQAESSRVPFFGPAYSTMSSGLRLGENLVAAALPLPGDAEQNWTALTGLWCFLLALAGASIAHLAGLGPLMRGVVGLLAGSSALVLFQVFNQNGPSLLGMAFALVLAAAMPMAVGTPTRNVLIAGVLLAALVGTYSELAAILAPALAAFVLIRGRPWLPPVSRAALVVAVGVACAPLAWLRAWESLQLVAGAGAIPGELSGLGPVPFLAKVLGVAPFEGTVPPLTVLQLSAIAAILAFAVVGVLASSLQPTRVLWPVFAVTVLLYGLRLASADPPYGYSLARLAMFTMPLLLAAAAVGVAGLAARSDDKSSTGRWSGIAGATTVGVIVVGMSTTLDYLREVRSDIRAVDPTYAQANDWIDEVDGPDGAQTGVAAFDFVHQLWISEAMRERPSVAYPVLDPGYLRVSAAWDGADNRYLLVDTGVMRLASAGSVVEENERFALLDTSAGEVAVFAPQGFTSGSGWLPNHPLGMQRTDADPTPDAWMVEQASAFLAGPSSGDVRLAIQPDPALGPVNLTITGSGIETVDTVLTGPSEVAVTFLPGSRSSRVQLTATPTSGAEPVGRTLLFTGLTAGGEGT